MPRLPPTHDTLVRQPRWLCKYENLEQNVRNFMSFQFANWPEERQIPNWNRECDTRSQWFLFNCDFISPSLFPHSHSHSRSLYLSCWLATAWMRQWWMTELNWEWVKSFCQLKYECLIRFLMSQTAKKKQVNCLPQLQARTEQFFLKISMKLISSICRYSCRRKKHLWRNMYI